MALPEEELNKFRRTKSPDNNNGDIPLFFCRECDTFPTFETCYASWQSKGYASSTVPGLRQEFATLGSRKDGIQLIGFLEKNFECNGICDTGLFYYTRDLASGVPQSTCLASLKGEIQNNATYLGLAILATGVLCLVTWVLQYALWSN